MDKQKYITIKSQPITTEIYVGTGEDKNGYAALWDYILKQDSKTSIQLTRSIFNTIKK